jgi:hypothetical protein
MYESLNFFSLLVFIPNAGLPHGVNGLVRPIGASFTTMGDHMDSLLNREQLDVYLTNEFYQLYHFGLKMHHCYF